jgi:hypothetical protein
MFSQTHRRLIAGRGCAATMSVAKQKAARVFAPELLVPNPKLLLREQLREVMNCYGHGA